MHVHYHHVSESNNKIAVHYLELGTATNSAILQVNVASCLTPFGPT